MVSSTENCTEQKTSFQKISKIFLSIVLLEKRVPDVEVSPVDEIEDSEKNWRTDEEEAVDVGVLVVPRRVLLLGDCGLPAPTF